ncbi:hypothetical protein CRM22_001801 [Opisthorchis felineus]|uniref:C2 domain-containing protein n=1 Tax=Opisthorchis felineus TaxID=147828 RepID=A0A4V3SGM6_OPIFE|nr:hypothetical protein CRM22_001801 [Opisthorchis felineus]
MLGGMDIPKSVTIVVKCAENLEYSMPGSKKSAKTRRWHVVVAGGKKKMVSDVVDAQDGCPTWDTEFNIDLVSPTDPVVMLVLDGERRHIGQVVIPLAQVPRTGPPNFDPSRLRYSELEPTKKNSCPRGRLVYWIWATSYWPPGTKLDSKSKSHKGSISHLGRPKSRSSKAASMVSGAYSESNLSAQTSYMGGYPMTGGGAPSSVAWTNRPGATLGTGGTASYNPLASYDEEGSMRGSQQYGSDVDDPGRPPLYRSALQLKSNQAGYAESTASGYSAKRGLMRKMKGKISKSTLSITQAVAKKAGGDKLYPDPHGSVLSVASSREHIQFPDSTSGQNQRPPSGSMTSLPRENYAPDGAVRSGPTDMNETEEDVVQTPKIELREARKSMYASEPSEDVVQTPKMRRSTYVSMSSDVRKSVDQSENVKARKSIFEPQKDGETSKVRRSMLTIEPPKDEIRKASPRRSRKTDAGRAGSFGSTNRTPETPPSNNWFLHAEERPNKPLEDMSHRELLNYAMQQQRSAQVTRAELARVQNERDEISKKAEQSEKELDTVRASLADLRFRLLTAGLTDFLELPSAAEGRSTSLKFDNPFPGRDTRTAFSVGGFHAEPATTDVHQTFLDKLKKFGLGSQNDEPSVPSVPAVAPTTNWW